MSVLRQIFSQGNRLWSPGDGVGAWLIETAFMFGTLPALYVEAKTKNKALRVLGLLFAFLWFVATAVLHGPVTMIGFMIWVYEEA